MDFEVKPKEEPKAHDMVRSRSTGSLGEVAEKAGWIQVGYVAQNTRYQLPDNEMRESAHHMYAEECDSKRFMRWIATYLSANYNISSEVQCYHEQTTCRILVAANENSDLKILESGLHRMRLVDFFKKVSKEPVAIKSSRTSETLKARQLRQGKELKRLADMAGKSKNVTWSSYSFFVVPPIRGVSSLHAEQRILHYLREEAIGWRKDDLLDEDEGAMTVDERSGKLMLRPELLGGIKRPCFICAHACFTPYDRNKVHPGLLWDTKCAGGILDDDAYEDTKEAIKKHRAVYKSRTECGEAEDVDSESESEEEFYPRILRRLRSMPSLKELENIWNS